jgi:tyrosine-protein kinase Etk/Wzc
MQSTIEPELKTEDRQVTPESYAEVQLLDLLIILAKRKWMILSVTVAMGLACLVFSLLLPRYYQANTKILPPQQTQSIAGAMIGQLGSLANFAGKDLGIRNPNDLYIAMLKSRTVSDALVQKFDLENLYQVSRQMDARKRLEEITEIQSGKDGVISISVEDRDPKRASDIANAYVSELYRLTQTLAIGEAAQRRLFFENQLRTANDDLARSEQELRKTQEKTGLIQLDSQAKATIESVSRARAQIAAKQVQIQAMKSFATPENPDLARSEIELAAMRTQLATLERNQASPAGDLQLPAGKLPSAGLEYVRSLREVKYRETVFELLAKQYEIAKIDEAKSAAVIQILDPAVTPEAKSRPKRAMIVITGTLLGLFFAIIAAFVLEAAQYGQRQPEISTRLQQLKSYLYAGPGEV